MRFLISLLALALVFARAEATAQQNGLPRGLESCSPTGTERSLNFRRTQIFSNCAPTTGASEEYGRVFVQFIPPDGAGAQNVSERERRNFWQRLRRFFLPNTRSGSILLTLTLIQGGQEIPLDIVPLASYSIDERNGLQVRNLTSNQSNDVGFRFRVNDQTRVRAHLVIEQSNSTTSNIVSTADDLRRTALGLGYLPAVDFASTLAPLRELEARIVAQARFGNVESQPDQLGFNAAGFSAVRHRLRFFESNPATGSAAPYNGSLVVAIRRDVTAFSIPRARAPIQVVEGQVEYRMDGYVTANTSPVRNGLIRGESLEAHLQRMMGGTFLFLSSDDPGQFQVACSALQTAVADRSLNLATQDRVLAVWAAIASNRNVDLAALRSDRSCLGLELSTFRIFGLPFAPVREAQFPRAQSASVTNEGTLRLGAFYAVGGTSENYIYHGSGGTQPSLGSVNVTSRVSGQPTPEENFVRGRRSNVVVLGPARDHLLFLAYLDRDGDGFVDAVSRTFWDEPAGPFHVTSSNGGVEDDCDRYQIAIGPSGQRRAELVACPTDAGWRAPGENGQPLPRAIAFSNGDRIQTQVTAVINGVCDGNFC